MWIIRASVRLRKLPLSLLRKKLPQNLLPGFLAVFFMVFLLFLSFEIIFLRVDRISAPAMDH
ncbi:MAG: hypothetical protein BHV93_06570 [Clostridiales bacterium 52_15]|nr:MAG: hypothetical protein BHV93_06570 [Clostridiales bacterium 52_15]